MTNNPICKPFAEYTPADRMSAGSICAGDWLKTAVLRLQSKENFQAEDDCQSEKSRHEAMLEAQVLLAHALGRSRAWLLAHPETVLEPDVLFSLENQLAQLLAGVPLPYLTGQQEFFGLRFEVTPEVLIPRPETELLVETALAWLQAHPQARRAADIGTGSGCIAVCLAAHTPDLCIFGVDCSRAALRVASRNLEHHGLAERTPLLQGHLTTALSGPLDLLCANLPYIPTGKLGDLPVARHEPRLALDGGPDGLRLVENLLVDAPRLLAPGGLVLLEIEAGQGRTAAQLARRCFPRGRVEVRQDLAGLDRLVQIENSF